VDKPENMLSRISRLCCNVGAAGLLLLAVLVSADVIVRAFTDRPIVGVFELSGVMLVAITFLPLSYVLLNSRQMRIDIIYEFVGTKVRLLLSILDALLGILIFGAIFSVALDETMKAYAGRYLLRGLVEIPTWIPYFTISIGMILSMSVLVTQCVKRAIELRGTR